MYRQIGIYPGTFDPIHGGHIAFAKEALRLFDLEKVVFLPEKRPRQKHDVSDIAVRQAQLAKTLALEPNLESYVLKSDQFTVQQTLPELHQFIPSSKFVFLMGSDVALHLSSWQNLPLLLASVSILVAIREGDLLQEVEQVFQEIEDVTHASVHYSIIDSPNPALRSSTIRNET